MDIDYILNNFDCKAEDNAKDSNDSMSEEENGIFYAKERVLKRFDKRAKPSKKPKDIKKTPVWRDEDDESELVEVPTKKRKWTQEERAENFQRIVGEPSWLKRCHESDSDEDELLKTSGNLITTSGKLKDGVLGIKRMKDLNRSTYSEHNITSVIFHPSSTVAICTGENGVANIYAVDGKKNEKLHSIGFEDYQITSAVLVDGRELIVGGRRPFFHTYDLIAGKSEQIKLPKALNVTNLRNIRLSPDGKCFASMGKFGEIHLFDTKSKELLRTFKQEYMATAVDFTPDSKYLFAHSRYNEVTIFDICSSKPTSKWIDEGCVNGTTLNICNGLIATGSAQGVANIYDLASVQKEKYPQAIKSFVNLTTKITTTQFNPSSELLVFSSSEVAESAKMAHFPSCNVFTNFPGTFSKLGQPTSVAFSPNSGYMAIGNRKNTVALFRLKHYSDY